MMVSIRQMRAIGMAWIFGLATTVPALAVQQAAKSDAAFLNTVAARQQSEIHLSELAMERSGSEQIKQFAQRMVQDHSKALQEVNKLLTTLGVPLRSETPNGTKQPKGKLSSLSGAAFDRAYVRRQIADHQKTVSDFAAKTKTVKHSQIREWIFATLPVLKEHLSLAKDLASKPAQPVRE